MQACIDSVHGGKVRNQARASSVLSRRPDAWLRCSSSCLVGDLRRQLAQLLKDGLQGVAGHERPQVAATRGDDAHDHVQVVGAVPERDGMAITQKTRVESTFAQAASVHCRRHACRLADSLDKACVGLGVLLSVVGGDLVEGSHERREHILILRQGRGWEGTVGCFTLRKGQEVMNRACVWPIHKRTINLRRGGLHLLLLLLLLACCT